MTEAHRPDGSPHTHDSAGQGFAGRSLDPTGFEHDDGSADEALVIARSDPTDERGWMAAVSAARFLVPVLAVAGELDEVDGRVVEKSSDMAMVTLTAPDGQRALPVFTGTAALQEWDESARPIPATAARVAQAAVGERCDVIVVDVAGPDPFVLRPSMVWALAQGREWVPPHEDPFVAQALDGAVAGIDEVTGHGVAAGTEAGELVVELEIVPGLGQEQLQSVVQRVGERLAGDGELRARIDALTFRVR